MISSLLITIACSGESVSSSEDTIKIGVLASLTGPLETYGKQTVLGFELGLQYATDGTNEVAGKKIEFVVEDTETKPDVAVRKAMKLLEEDKVDFLVGSSSSGDTLAVLPLAEEYEKIMVVVFYEGVVESVPVPVVP
ncbi:ABC transporter substrate-binding protein [Sutcliffiella halmapala]|uniref:ABC transporter substrate-binding protein n=1 Tax=Sutcliffiella halmapala TaxID=79882 RepID=UPI00099528C7|nr:ABC transporter substrate-binding protein [Sutcliffiella halmapala]